MRCLLKKTRFYFLITFAAACFLLAVIPVSAVSITESPSVVTRGGQVTVTMNDLNDGSQFSLLIDGEFNTVPGERFSFQTNSFTMPISLNNGQISATTRGTRLTAFSAMTEGTTIGNVQQADESGFYSFSTAHNIPSGFYDYLRLEGQARSDVTTITSSMNLVGTKKGAKDSQITFSIDGIDNGLVRLTILVDGQAALPTKTITVGSGLTPVTTTTTTPVPTGTTTATTTTTTTATGTGTTQATTTATQTGTATTTTSAATTTTGVATSGTTTGVATSGTTTGFSTTGTTTGTSTPGTTATALPVKTFYSADQKVSLATQGIDYAGFLMVRGAAIPADWLAISDVYTIAPDTLVFSPQATLSFTIPKAPGADYAYFVGRYENSQWTIVPSSAGTNTIEARISRAGTYGLMAYKPESTVPATGVTTAAGTAASTPTVKGTPRIASVAAAIPAATTTKQSPLELLVLPCALAICCALVLRRE